MSYVVKKVDITDIEYEIYDEDKDLATENRYLLHKKRAHASPNTIKRIAYSLSYYSDYLTKMELDILSVIELPYAEQHEHFNDYLQYLKRGKHTTRRDNRKNVSCNMYLGDVLRYYQFLYLQYENYGELKILTDRTMTIRNDIGLSKKVSGKTFKGYLTNDKSQGDTIEEKDLLKVIDACTNIRDRLLLMMFAETGFRIGEILGIDYLSDIDYENKAISVVGRENNLNFARAKNNERRKGYLSDETFQLLMIYLMKYKSLIEKGTTLFVVIKGEEAGKPLTDNAVYSMFRRMAKKAGVTTHPHAIRHYFATERWKNDWDLLLISKALGHKSIQTTINYLNIGSEELRGAAESYYDDNDAIRMIEDLI